VIPVSVAQLAGGDSGVSQTFARMASLVHAAQVDPVVVYAARVLVGSTGRGQYAGAQAIKAWMVRVFRYVDDPVNVELLVSPSQMIADADADSVVYGDCDEAAVLGAALGMAAGIPAMFTALAFDDDPTRLAHVFVTLLPSDGARVTLDITRPPGPLPRVTRIVTQTL
jgi:hypothetical protein